MTFKKRWQSDDAVWGNIRFKSRLIIAHAGIENAGLLIEQEAQLIFKAVHATRVAVANEFRKFHDVVGKELIQNIPANWVIV